MRELQAFTALIRTLFLLIVVRSSTGQDSLLLVFKQCSDVPIEVYLGLLPGSSNVEKISLVNGTCFQYQVIKFNRCKYYSDCCAMTPSRPAEQLAPKTFSCHDGYYIVDRCPPVTANRELRDLCEKHSPTDSGKFSLWLQIKKVSGNFRLKFFCF